MAKIPFTLEAWLKDKSRKVETRDGRTARIICTDAKADDGACVIALITGYGGEEAYQFFPNGHAFSSKSSDEDSTDLFIVTPEPELNEFEQAVKDLCWKVGIIGEVFYKDDIIKKTAAGLLDLARKEIMDGWSKGLRDTQDHSGKAYSDGYNLGSKFGYERGKAEALKDLPRWKKCGVDTGQTNLIRGYSRDEDMLYRNGRKISLMSLEKLPGFKED